MVNNVQIPLPPANLLENMLVDNPNIVTKAIPVLEDVAIGVTAADLALPLLVIGGTYVAGNMIYHWTQDQQKEIQNKVQSIQGYTDNTIYLVYYKIKPNGNPNEPWFEKPTPIYIQGPLKDIEFSDEPTGTNNSRTYINGFDTFGGPNWRIYQPTVTRIERLDGKDTSNWNTLTDAQKKAALHQLEPNDWYHPFKSMQYGGTIQDGQTIDHPVVLTGNPDSDNVGERDPRVINHPGTARKSVNDRLDDLEKHFRNLPGDINREVQNAVAAAALAGGIAKAEDITKLGTTLGSKFEETFTRLKAIAGAINFDRILLLMTWWQTLHNAFMLSADIGRTLVSGISTALAALPGNSVLGIPTEQADGTPLDLGKQINEFFESWIKRAIGVNNYATMQAELKAANRVYQAASNVLSEVQNMINDLQNVTNVIGEYTGKIGNSLKAFGVVGEKAYNWMSENMNTKANWASKFEERLQTLQSAASNLESVANSVYSAEQSVVQLKKNTQEFKDALKEATPGTTENNAKIKEQQDANKEASKSPDIANTDLKKPD